MGYSHLYLDPPVEELKISWGGGHFFPNGKFHGGSHFWTVISKEGVKNTYKMLEIPWEGGGNSVRNSMGGWLTCVGNSMEWSKNAVGNSMGEVENNGVPPRGRGGGVQI